jgi:hypothetical protein
MKRRREAVYIGKYSRTELSRLHPIRAYYQR